VTGSAQPIRPQALPSVPPVGTVLDSAQAPARVIWGTRSQNPLIAALTRTVRNPVGASGLIILVVLALIAAGAPLLAPYGPVEQHPGDELARPSAKYILGADNLGRDLLSRIIWGSRVSFFVGVMAVLLGATVGVSTGLLAGYLGGWVDAAIMRVYDALLAFPTILLGIAVVAVLGAGGPNVAIAIALAQMPTFARLTRSLVQTERERDYVLAARSLGVPSSRIMRRHVLPNSLGPLLVQMSLAMGFSVLAESSLSFLGLGTLPPEPSWGGMLNDSRAHLRQAPWFGIWPGVALASLLVGLNYFSDALRDALDPRRINDT
jgi:peptide/nickel transport system permease protein